MGGTELAAGGFDILPLALADYGRDILGPEGLLEAQEFLRRRSLIRRARGGVVGDEVQLGLQAGTDLKRSLVFPILLFSSISLH